MKKMYILYIIVSSIKSLTSNKLRLELYFNVEELIHYKLRETIKLTHEISFIVKLQTDNDSRYNLKSKL